MKTSSPSAEVTLRLVWPPWQGAGTVSVRQFASEFTFDVARRGYAVGAAVLEAILPPHPGPTVTAPVTLTNEGLAEQDGVEAKAVVLAQLADALSLIAEHNCHRILTLGGECSVSVAPFAALADRYGDDLAIVWIDSHPDVGTGDSQYPGYHAMAVSALTGHGDPDVLALLPATVTPDRVALVGLHSWTDAHASVRAWTPATTTHPSPGWSSARLLASMETCGPATCSGPAGPPEPS